MSTTVASLRHFFSHERAARWLRFGTLSLSLAGSQVIWSLELAYGTPYLLTIGLSKEATGYVWMAGPLSGLVIQPILGAISDASTSQYRRRKYIVGSTVCVTLATCMVAFSEPLSTLILDLLGLGLGDWDPVRHERIKFLTQFFSVLGFWVLNFAINGLQVIARALILDSAAASEQNEANVWHGLMLHVGNIIGYWCGYEDLASWSILAWLGGGQFRRFAMLSLVCMIVCVAITCITTKESSVHTPPGQNHSAWHNVKASVRQIWQVGRTLPLSIRRVCYAQLLAAMSWFPFLFYGTTFVLDMAEGKSKRKTERAEKHGSLALLVFAIIAFVCGLVLPSLSIAGKVDVDHHIAAQDMVDDSVSMPRPPPAHPRGLCLHTIWTIGALVQALLLMACFFVRTEKQAMLVLMLLGIPWSVWMWVPYAMIGEFVREAEGGGKLLTVADDQRSAQRIMDLQRSSTHSESDPLLPKRHGSSSATAGRRNVSGSQPPSIVSRGREVVRSNGEMSQEDSACGGTVLGIHNMAIVIPQFLTSLLMSFIFRFTKESQHNVKWVLVLSGVMSLGAAFLIRFVPMTLSERMVLSTGPTSHLAHEDPESAH
ncbi:sucrose:proton symporter [Malassezia pachydermatis]|uniref:General alpha-glucoside permease n=1 Tax=Malassezia pachydermatis TaxID=77020 RepID=A0A0M9VNX4_9BASI|nr:hypothetical protein Malapachy_1804 [Malassezia pachydermatis]KOS13775.1 hypothetical protein Malapachy_1804 [Malassezia pachydermatis]